MVPIRTTAAAAISGRRQVAPEEVEVEIINKDNLEKNLMLSTLMDKMEHSCQGLESKIQELEEKEKITAGTPGAAH